MPWYLNLAFCLAVIGAVLAFIYWPVNVEEKGEEDPVEPAFDDDVSHDKLSPAVVERIGNLVDRVGVVYTTVMRTNHEGGRSELLTWEIYLLDVNGAFHRVATHTQEWVAAKIAMEVSELFHVPLDDPEYITAGRN